MVLNCRTAWTQHEPPGDEGDLVDDLVPVPPVFHPVPEIGVGGVPVVADVEHGGVGGCRAQGGPRLGFLPEMAFHGALLILGPGCGEHLELREQRFHLLGGRHVPYGRAEPDELAQLGDQPVPLAHLLGEIQHDLPQLVPVLALQLCHRDLRRFHATMIAQNAVLINISG